jgi:hypothetical protein
MGKIIVKQIELIPITLRNKNGVLYVRSPEVESKIKEALALDRKRLVERANQKDHESEEYIPPECLVYLIRTFWREGDGELAIELTSALIERAGKKINSILRKQLSLYYVNECFPEVVDEITGQIFEITSIRVEYAEYHFWRWLRNLTCNVRRKYKKIQKIDSVKENYERELEGYTTDISDALEKKEALKKARKILSDKEWQIYVMRYVLEWPIYSEDQSVKTISQHFNVSDRCVRKWFEKAEEKLRNGSRG